MDEPTLSRIFIDLDEGPDNEYRRVTLMPLDGSPPEEFRVPLVRMARLLEECRAEFEIEVLRGYKRTSGDLTPPEKRRELVGAAVKIGVDEAKRRVGLMRRGDEIPLGYSPRTEDSFAFATRLPEGAVREILEKASK